MCGDSPDAEAGDGAEFDRRIARQEYEISAEIELEHAAFVLSPCTERAAGATVELASLDIEADDSRFLFSVTDSDFERFEAALAADPTVTDPTRICTRPSLRWYRAEAADAAESPLVPLSRRSVFVRRAAAADGYWSFRIRFPDRETLIALQSACRNRGIELRVKRLVEVGDATDRDEYHGLTDEQYRLLTLAYENGYFDVPRRISQTKLAEDLGVSASAISQTLRRATAALIESTLHGRPP